jgi:predicted nuclease of restriction endonuclease-like (RecB) superfamily
MKKVARAEPTVCDRVQCILASARTHAARSVNTAQVVANWLIGREIVEDQQHGARRAGYGERLVFQLARTLKREGFAGYGELTLNLCRQFYLGFPGLITLPMGYASRAQVPRGAERTPNLYALRKQSAASAFDQMISLVPQIIAAARDDVPQPGQLHPGLSWTHYRALLRISKPEARSFYEIEAIHQNWKARELERQINSLLYERLAKSRDKKGVIALATRGHDIQKPADVFKDPVVIEFLGLPESHRLMETKLEAALISNLQQFLLELGKGFAFVARQKRLTLEGDHFYVDLVFYHTVLKCYVLIDLKVGKLTHQDLGQLQLYVNYYDRERRTPGDNPTLGLILCTDKNDTAVKYTLGADQQNIFTSRYQFHLPSEEDLTTEIRRELALIAPAVSATATKRPSPRKRRTLNGAPP